MPGRRRFAAVASMALTLILCMLSLTVTLNSAASIGDVSISSVTLLLPSNVCSNRLKPAQHPLKAFGGCFRWHSSAPHIVKVTPSTPIPDDEDDSVTIGPDSSLCQVGGVWGTTEAIVTVVNEDLIPKNTAAQNGGGSSSSSAPVSGGATAAASSSSLASGSPTAASSASSSGRQSAWVWAEDLTTGHRAECEVYVDHVSSLIIGTSTRRINVGDTESLDVQAFDEHGSVFSTVEGLPFSWVNSAEHIARRLTFAEANMNVSHTLLALEREGFAGDRLPIQGVIPGRANFTVRLLCPGPLVQTTVEMLVTEPLGIHPSLTRVCPDTSARLRLYTRHHKAHLIEAADASSSSSASATSQGEAEALEVVEGNRVLRMPSTQYKWRSSNTTLVTVDADIGVVKTARHLGHTQIIVDDNSLNEQSCKADIIVAEPVRLEIHLHRALHMSTRPFLASRDMPAPRLRDLLARNTGMQTPQDFERHAAKDHPFPRCDGSYYVSQGAPLTAKVFLLDQWDRVIDICQGVTVSVAEGSSLSLLETEGMWSALLASRTEVGPAILKASLSRGEDLPPLEASVRIFVTPPVTLSDSFALIPQPAVPYSKAVASGDQCSTTISASGGSGHFHWSSSASGIATAAADPTLAVAPSNDPSSYKASLTTPLSSFTTAQLTRLGRMLAMGPVGSSVIHVQDRCNPDNVARLTVEVSPAGQVCRIPGPVELLTGSSLEVLLHVKDVQGRTFHNCSCLRVSTALAEGTSVAIATPEDAVRCSNDCPVPESSTSTPALPSSSSSSTETGKDAAAAAVGLAAGASETGSSSSSRTCNCFKVLVKALAPGFTRLTARVRTSALPAATTAAPSPAQESAADRKVAANSAGPFEGFGPHVSETFAVFDPVSVDLGEVVAAVGTSVTLSWRNGPLPWPCHLDGFARERGGFALCRPSPPNASPLVGPFLAEPARRGHGRALIAQRNTQQSMYVHDPAVTALDSSATFAEAGIVSVTRVKTNTPNGHGFSVKCLDTSSPNAPVSVVIRAGNTPCPSNPVPLSSAASVRVSCYPVLCFGARKITLAIGAQEQVTLAYADHPLRANLTYYVEEPDIAHVDPKTGLVTGKALGFTVLHVRLRHPSLERLHWGEDGLHDVLLVHVAFAGFYIDVGSSALSLGEETTVSVRGSMGEKPSDSSFSLVSVQWHIQEGPRAGLALRPTWHSALPLASLQASASQEYAGTVSSTPGSSSLSSSGTTSGLSYGGGAGSSGLAAASTAQSLHVARTRLAHRAGWVLPQTAWVLTTSAPTARISARGATGSYTLVARVSVAYRGLSAQSQAVLQPPQSTGSVCPAVPQVSSKGEVVQYTLRKTVHILPRMRLTSPSSLLLPPGGKSVVSTSLDSSNVFRMGYAVSTSTGVVPVPDGSTASVASAGASGSPLHIDSRGYLTAPVAEESDSFVRVSATLTNPKQVAAATLTGGNAAAAVVGGDSDAVDVDAAVVAKTVTTMAQAVAVTVSVRQPKSLEILPVAPLPTVQAPTLAAQLVDMDFAAAARSPTSALSPSMASREARSMLMLDGSVGSMVSEPLCVLNDAKSATAPTADSATGPITASYASNVTIQVALRDGRGRLFDAVDLTSREGTFGVSVNRPDLVQVRSLATAPGFALAGAVHNNGSEPMATTAPPGILASLSIVATAHAPSSASHGHVTPVQITLNVAHPSWNHVAELHLQVFIGSDIQCRVPTWRPLGARLAVPISLPALRSLSPIRSDRTPATADRFSSKQFGVSSTSLIDAQGAASSRSGSKSTSSSSWLWSSSSSEVDALAFAEDRPEAFDAAAMASLETDPTLAGDSLSQATISSTALVNARTEYLRTAQTAIASALEHIIADVSPVFASTKTGFKPLVYVRSIDVTTGLALVDVIASPLREHVEAILTPSSQFPSLDKASIPHADEWPLRVGAAWARAWQSADVADVVEQYARLVPALVKTLAKKHFGVAARTRRGSNSGKSTTRRQQHRQGQSADGKSQGKGGQRAGTAGFDETALLSLFDTTRPLQFTAAPFSASFSSLLAHAVTSSIDEEAARVAAAAMTAASTTPASQLSSSHFSPALASFWPFSTEPLVAWAWHQGHTAVSLRCLSALHHTAASLERARAEFVRSSLSMSTSAQAIAASLSESMGSSSPLGIGGSDSNVGDRLFDDPCLEVAISTSGSERPDWWAAVLVKAWAWREAAVRADRLELLQEIKDLRAALSEGGATAGGSKASFEQKRRYRRDATARGSSQSVSHRKGAAGGATGPGAVSSGAHTGEGAGEWSRMMIFTAAALAVGIVVAFKQLRSGPAAVKRLQPAGMGAIGSGVGVAVPVGPGGFTGPIGTGEYEDDDM